jgi:hypothetical protein
MRCISSLRRDQRGRAAINFAAALTLAAMPLIYPAKTRMILDETKATLQGLGTIRGITSHPA